MLLTLHRHYLGKEYTIGKLFIDGVPFCDTLEDVVRDRNKDGDLNDPGEGKIYGQTAIPYGVYRVVVNMSPKFKRLLPRLLDVPHFEGILMHNGRHKDHTLGCILVGENKVKGQVIDGKIWEKKLVEILLNVQEKGEPIKIEII